MPSGTDIPQPLSRDAIDQSIRERPALRDNLAQFTKSIFVTGGEKVPEVRTHILPTERVIDGQRAQQYEVRIEVVGVRLGERASPPPMRGELIQDRIPTERLGDFESLLTPFVPDHLSIDPQPRRLMRALPRIPQRLQDERRHVTTIFNPDQRQVFRDTNYPWSAFGRCETNFGPFSGAMIGPRHLLTCNHGIDWTPPPGFAADWLTFTPSYYDGDAPFGTTYATHVYWIKKNDNDPWIAGDEDQYDYVVLVLNDRIGDRTGWLGARRYTDTWDPLEVWWHIGYPADITLSARPTYQSWFSMNGDDIQDDAHQAFYHQADVFPGQSGGPMFGFWDGDVGPRAVAVQSWQSSGSNGASGGSDLVDLVIRARNDHP